MKLFAIIAEYNPFHSGHLYHINKTLESSDKLIVIMSGSFTQRGDVAIDNKYSRAANAIRAGADMVIELPSVFAVSPADKFAYGAIKTLKQLPINYLSFGSECGDINKLYSTIEILDNETADIKNVIKCNLEYGMPLVKARAEAFTKSLSQINLTPNNTLALEYLRQIKDTDIKPLTIKREGNFYNDLSISGEYLSATAIRELIYLNQYDKVKKHIPYPINYNTNALKNLGQMIMYKLNIMNSQDIKDIFDVTEGLENRIINNLHYTTFSDFIYNLKTKRYTLSRLKRILISCLLDITYDYHNMAINAQPYVNILAIKNSSRNLISKITTSNIYTKPSDYNTLSQDAKRIIDLDNLAHKLACIINEDSSNLNSMQVIT